MTPEYLKNLTRHIRIGAHAQEIDGLSACSDGMLNSKTLSGVAKDVWPYDVARPCSITFDKDQRVSLISGTLDLVHIEGVSETDTLVEINARFPDVREVYCGSFLKEMGRVSLNFGPDASGAIRVCGFTNGVQTSRSLWSLEYLDKYQADFRAAHAREETAERDKVDSRANDDAERAAKKVWQRTAQPDDVLRDWAATFSHWNERPKEWQRLADWLIKDATPIERHLLVERLSMSVGLEIPRWIVRQPDTQLATALTLFWNLGPSQFVHTIGHRDEIPERLSETYDVWMQIAQNVTNGFYATPLPWSRIAFAPPAPLPWDASLPGIRRAVQLLVPNAALAPVKGRKASNLGKLTNLPFDMEILR